MLHCKARCSHLVNSQVLLVDPSNVLHTEETVRTYATVTQSFVFYNFEQDFRVVRRLKSYGRKA